MQIEMWSDFACPWCALGHFRLEEARRIFEHGDAVTVDHRSFELRPQAPARLEGTYQDAVRAKYDMPVERVRAGQEQLTRFGAEVGLAFDFDRVRLGSTFDAHRLAQAARGGLHEDTLVTGLFVAHFSQGRQLSDHAVLRDVAGAAGMADAVVDEVLDSDLYGIEVRTDETAAAEMDVTGVPYFLIDGVWPVPGAQDVDTLVLLLRRAWSRLGH
jgi:predicted DsbA family dithiol-disulfide isomerase